MKKSGVKPSFSAKQESTFMPSAQLARSKASITALKPGNSFPVGQSFAMRGSVI